MAEIVPRWEWRTFGDAFGAAEEAFAALTAERVDESDELYLLARASDASVKVREGLLDVKHLQGVDEDGLEQWVPVMKGAFPLAAEGVGTMLARLRAAAPPLDRAAYTLAELVDEVVRPNEALLAVEVHKRRARYTVGGCMAELSEVGTKQGATRTIAVESEDPSRVLAAVRALGLASRANVCMARGLKTLVGFATTRYAVIDVGTNSVKLHVGERRADGTWSTISDRAAVTRLGEGLDALGSLEPEPMKRTLAAIAAMADESRRAGAVAIAAVGTAGLRTAANGAEFVSAVEADCGVRIEVIPGEEEGRLAYLAAKSGLNLARGSLVVFDTGGGSSQFTFGRDDVVDEQFSVPVGAVRLTERHGLDRPVSDEALASALDAIGSELDVLDARPSPDVLVGMGGALTNLAAVKHGLAAYDRDVVQGTRLDQAEIDRQIELYRTRTADERRAVVGLQPSRAEVILAGACVVRTVLTKLGCESLLVSDSGLRHGLIVDRFGLGPPVG
jgi:exopolyphosphatase/guanosine-5'-triphosphate,3'-diphosphate pyrophosphatase